MALVGLGDVMTTDQREEENAQIEKWERTLYFISYNKIMLSPILLLILCDHAKG